MILHACRDRNFCEQSELYVKDGIVQMDEQLESFRKNE